MYITWLLLFVPGQNSPPSLSASGSVHVPIKKERFVHLSILVLQKMTYLYDCGPSTLEDQVVIMENYKEN